MHQYILKRLLLMIPTLLGAGLLVFVLLRMIPGDICVLRMAGGSGYIDRDVDKMFQAMNGEPDPAKQRKIMRDFEKRVLDDEAHSFITLWWNRIIPHRSYVKGWKISPSHYINQDLANVWLDK